MAFHHASPPPQKLNIESIERGKNNWSWPPTFTSSVDPPKCCGRRRKRVDHSIWIKHKWTCTSSSAAKNRRKKSHKSQSLETGNKRAYTNNREPHRPHPANQYRRFCLDLAINTICKQFEIPCSNHLMATRRFDVAAAPLQCPTQISIFNWLILMHTRRTVNDAQVAGVWERKKTIEIAEYDGRWSMPHRKYRCLNWIFMRVRVWQAAWFEYHFFCFYLHVQFLPFLWLRNTVPGATPFHHIFFSFSVFARTLWAFSVFLEGGRPFHVHLHWPNDEKQSKWKFHCSDSFGWNAPRNALKNESAGTFFEWR